MMSAETQKKHQTKMARKKRVVDDGINRANREQGLLLVLTGNGKGKSSSAFGMIARALGHGMNVGVAQFIKGSSNTGEESFFKNHPNVIWHVLGEGFTWETQNLEKDKQTAEKGWDVAREMLHDPSYDLIVLDELTYPLRYKWLDMDKVLTDLKARPAMQHVVVTGRGALSALVEAADTVTELVDKKHAYRDGIKAQKGIDL
ncbi:MAG: cob(I)yrinic acid a,c-diamide adenosyltransferase [bacterium]|nr:cob(I)yrinic acid a,c-diamide adenosyltransferase [bacterium]